MSTNRSADALRVSSLEPTRAYKVPAAHDGTSARTVELTTNFAPSFSAEIESLLRSRLGAVAICMAGVTAILSATALFLRRLMLVQVLQVAAFALLLGVIAVLYSKRQLSMRQLRIIEMGLFGFAGACVVTINLLMTGAEATKDGARGNLTGSLISTVTIWWGMMNLYLVLIPSSLKRLSAMMFLMALVPVVQIIVLRQSYPLVRELTSPQTMGRIVVQMTIAAGGTIFLGHVVGVLRCQALAGKLFGQYRLKELLGSGGMGEVRLAEHVLLKRPCAIKVIHPNRANDPDALARFEREVCAAAELTHPNTIAIYDYGRADDGSFYYVMEYLPGLTLAELVERHGTLSPERVIYLVRQVCGALAEAHARGLIHRDIKPGNIIITERGGSADFAKLLDFGLVKSGDDAIAGHVTQENVIAGSPLFMSPEQSIAGRKLDGRSDLYSLGAVAYFLLTGQPPFSGESPMEINRGPCARRRQTAFGAKQQGPKGFGDRCATLPRQRPRSKVP
jgi:serine/threonine-protein kinase